MNPSDMISSIVIRACNPPLPSSIIQHPSSIIHPHVAQGKGGEFIQPTIKLNQIKRLVLPSSVTLSQPSVLCRELVLPFESKKRFYDILLDWTITVDKGMIDDGWSSFHLSCPLLTNHLYDCVLPSGYVDDG